MTTSPRNSRRTGEPPLPPDSYYRDLTQWSAFQRRMRDYLLGVESALRELGDGSTELYNRTSVSVKEYGAIGDGTTDDTTAITDARDAVYAAGGGIVYFPAGTYKVTSAIGLLAGVDWAGASSISSVIVASTPGQDLFTNDTGGTLDHLVFCDFKVTTPNVAFVAGIAFKLLDVNDSKFVNLHVPKQGGGASGFDTVFKVDAQIAAYHNIFIGCKVQSVNGASYHSYHFTGANSNGGNSNRILGGQARSDSSTAVWIERGNNVFVSALSIEGNTTIGVHVEGESAAQFANATIIGCRFEPVAGGTGIHLDDYSKNCVVMGNTYDVATPITDTGVGNLILEGGTIGIRPPKYEDATRGAAGTVGRLIFNTDDGQLNVDNGTDWTLPDGTAT